MNINSDQNNNIVEIAKLLVYCHGRWTAQDCQQEQTAYAHMIKGLCGYYQYGCTNVSKDLTHVGFIMCYEKEFYVAHIKLTNTAEKWAVSYKKL